MMHYWYLASPYSHPDARIRQGRYELAVKAVAAYTKMGTRVYSPIVHWHEPAIKYELETGYQFWSQHDTWMIQAMTGVQVVMFDGWDQSDGIASEVIFCRQLHKPVIYVNPEHLFENSKLD